MFLQRKNMLWIIFLLFWALPHPGQIVRQKKLWTYLATKAQFNKLHFFSFTEYELYVVIVFFLTRDDIFFIYHLHDV